MTEKQPIKVPYYHADVASHVCKNLSRRDVDPDALSSEESVRLIRGQCARWNMHEPPTAMEWRLAQVWCNALMMVCVAFDDYCDPKWRELPEGSYISLAAGVVAEHFDYDRRPIEAGIAFLDQVRDHARFGDHPVEVRDTEARREYEGNGPTREQCMLGATLANAVKALCPAPKHDDLHPLNWTTPLWDRVRSPDAALAIRVASVVSVWQGSDWQTVADARLLLEEALEVCNVWEES